MRVSLYKSSINGVNEEKISTLTAPEMNNLHLERNNME
jgi:hypothetical protein